MKTKSAKKQVKNPAHKKPAQSDKWSGRVTKTSNALDLEQNIFKSKSPKKIASSLKHSADTSKRRKGTPFQSAMSMLNFYINRGGKNLSTAEKQPLEKAKDELRALYGKD